MGPYQTCEPCFGINGVLDLLCKVSLGSGSIWQRAGCCLPAHDVPHNPPTNTSVVWEVTFHPVGSLSTCPFPAQPHGTPPHCSVQSKPCLTTRHRGRTSSPSPKMPSSRMWRNRKEAGELVLSLPFP